MSGTVRTEVPSWDTTNDNNSNVAGINIAEGCPAANLNNGLRAVMGAVARVVDGSVPLASLNLTALTAGSATISGTLTLDTTCANPTDGANKGYVDAQVAALSASANTYAAGQASTALSQAETFATGAADNAQNAAESYAANAANTAAASAVTSAVQSAEQNAASTYLPLSGGGVTGSLDVSQNVTVSGAIYVDTANLDPIAAQSTGTSINSGNVRSFNAGGASGYFGSGNAGALVQFYNGANQVGEIATNGSSTQYNTTSDERLKAELQPMTDASTVIASVPVHTFVHKWDKSGSRVAGFLAHEIAKAVPNAVTGKQGATDKDGKPVYQMVDHSLCVPPLWAASSEHHETLVEHHRAIADLQAENAKLVAFITSKLGEIPV